MILQQPSVQ